MLAAAARRAPRRAGGLRVRAAYATAAAEQAPAAHDTFRAEELTVQLTDAPAAKPALDHTLQFGRTFTDHMLRVDWTAAGGWGAPRITPLQPFSVHPAAQTLQYGAHCFEGMKAYAGADGRPRLFRPELNMARFAASGARLALPGFCPAQLLRCLRALLRVEAAWVPPAPFSLYIRPVLMGTTPFLGVGPPSHASLFVVLSPCGPYLAATSAGGARKRVTLALEESLSRASPGGVGAFKVGGNYAPTVAPAAAAAARHGAAQVLFTAANASRPADADARTVAEAGAMNVFFVLTPAAADVASDAREELVTPPLDGTILPGVTRRSVLQLAADVAGGPAALRVCERAVTLGELAAAAREGRLAEIFATGTAASILPVDALLRGPHGAELRASRPHGPHTLAARVAAALADIQHARVPHEWCVGIDEDDA